MHDFMTTGELIREKRKEKKVSQKELARLTGLSIGSIQGYEQGRYKPKYDSLVKVAEALQVPINELAGIDNMNLIRDHWDEMLEGIYDSDIQIIVRKLNTRGKQRWIANGKDLTRIEEYTIMDKDELRKKYPQAEDIEPEAFSVTDPIRTNSNPTTT